MSDAIVIVGAGVTGLTSALLLSRAKKYRITIVAKHMPGDYDIEYASPFAGANIIPMSSKEDSRWEARTWRELKRLCENVPEAGIHFQKCQVQRRNKDKESGSGFPSYAFDAEPWYKDLFDDYHELPPKDVLPGYDSAAGFTGVCINTGVYLSWLVGQLLKKGVVFKRAIISHIREAKNLSHTGLPASVIINATGLGSYRLNGVKDAAMYPSRAQIVLVRNEASPMLICSGSDDGAGEEIYLMQRAAGGGTILGGTYHVGNWESQPDPAIAMRIMSRIVELRPEIAKGRGVAGLDVIRHAVGLRPCRKGGVRIEAERLDEGTAVVHNYGHGGYGYQTSYGYAEATLEAVEKIQNAQKSLAKL